MKNEIKNGNEKLALGLIYIIMKLQRAKPQHENTNKDNKSVFMNQN